MAQSVNVDGQTKVVVSINNGRDVVYWGIREACKDLTVDVVEVGVTELGKLCPVRVVKPKLSKAN